MKLVIAIFGLLSSLSAQVFCRPVDAQGGPDLPLFNVKKLVDISGHSPSKFSFVDSSPPQTRCYTRLTGAIALNNGKIVTELDVENPTFERWVSDSNLCSPPRLKESIFRFSKGIVEGQGHEPERKSISIPPEFCRVTDHWPPATDH